MRTLALPTKIGVLAVALAVGSAGLRTIAAAQAPADATPRAASAAPSGEDRRFVRDSVEANQLQVVLAQLATDHAASDAARRVARALLDEHQRADDALQELAARKGISLSDAPSGEPAPNDVEPRTASEPAAPASPEDLKPEHAQAFAALATLTGPELDARFARTLVSELERSRARFERAASGAHDPDIKGYAASTLPAIDDQLRRARELRRALDADGSSATPGATGGATGEARGTTPVAPPYARSVRGPQGTVPEPQPTSQR